MTSRNNPAVRRDETIRSILLGVFVLVSAITVALTERSLFIGNRSLVIPGAPVPQDKLPRDFMRIVDDYGVHIMKLGHRPLLGVFTAAPVAVPVPRDAGAPPPTMRFGYSVREMAVAGLPFMVGKEFGHVLYYETPREFVVTPVTDDYLRQVKIPTRAPLDSDDFHVWSYMWGWLFVVAIVGIGLFEFGALGRRREAEGMI